MNTPVLVLRLPVDVLEEFIIRVRKLKFGDFDIFQINLVAVDQIYSPQRLGSIFQKLLSLILFGSQIAFLSQVSDDAPHSADNGCDEHHERSQPLLAVNDLVVRAIRIGDRHADRDDAAKEVTLLRTRLAHFHAAGQVLDKIIDSVLIPCVSALVFRAGLTKVESKLTVF